MDSTDGNGWQLKRLQPYLAPFVIFSGLAVIIGVTAADSYEHEYLLARGNGQDGWVAAGLPVSIDGLLVVAAAAVLWAAAIGLRGFTRLWRPYLALGVGIGATVAANWYSGLHYIWLQRAVSVWSGLAVALVAEVVMWFIGARRRPPKSCACPPLPLTLAEWIPLARDELAARGENAGEEPLAERIGATRHRLRLELAALAAKDAAVAAEPSPGLPATAALNGGRRA